MLLLIPLSRTSYLKNKGLNFNQEEFGSKFTAFPPPLSAPSHGMPSKQYTNPLDVSPQGGTIFLSLPSAHTVSPAYPTKLKKGHFTLHLAFPKSKDTGQLISFFSCQLVSGNTTHQPVALLHLSLLLRGLQLWQYPEVPNPFISRNLRPVNKLMNSSYPRQVKAFSQSETYQLTLDVLSKQITNFRSQKGGTLL